jgi:hypothetical protein
VPVSVGYSEGDDDSIIADCLHLGDSYSTK